MITNGKMYIGPMLALGSLHEEAEGSMKTDRSAYQADWGTLLIFGIGYRAKNDFGILCHFHLLHDPCGKFFPHARFFVSHSANYAVFFSFYVRRTEFKV